MTIADAEQTKGSPLLAIAVGIAGWLVPGLGHVFLHKWGKALAYFVAVSMLALVGLMSHGNVFSYGGDALDRLGFFADVGSGVYYFTSHILFPAGPDVSRAAGDYGTRLIATAGVLNLLCVLEGVHIALGNASERQAA
jgi:hypothetical protein